ncbi:Protein Red [Acipenser ruthenus]|uniref:Protein Red n=1 Tax=Acipenser ruthenus TaxID=7906 RepID=A0A444V049_ACIRT|nr:Protein Red [Acipenser ruthenus]
MNYDEPNITRSFCVHVDQPLFCNPHPCTPSPGTFEEEKVKPDSDSSEEEAATKPTLTVSTSAQKTSQKGAEKGALSVKAERKTKAKAAPRSPKPTGGSTKETAVGKTIQQLLSIADSESPEPSDSDAEDKEATTAIKITGGKTQKTTGGKKPKNTGGKRASGMTESEQSSSEERKRKRPAGTAAAGAKKEKKKEKKSKLAKKLRLTSEDGKSVSPSSAKPSPISVKGEKREKTLRKARKDQQLVSKRLLQEESDHEGMEIAAEVLSKKEELCLYTLGNLTAESEAVRKQLLAQGIIPALASCIQSPHAAVVEAVGYTLSQLLQAKEAPEKIIPSVLESGVTSHLLRLLQSDSEFGIGAAIECAWCLHYIISSNANTNLLMVQGAVSKCTSLLVALGGAVASGTATEGMDLVISPVLRCLGNLLANHGMESCREQMRDSRVLVALCAFIQGFLQQRPSVARESLWVINNLTADDPVFCSAVFYLNLVPVFMQLLPFSKGINIMVLRLLCNIAEKGPVYCQQLQQREIFSALHATLRMAEPKVFRLSLELLHIIVASIPQVADEFTEKGISALEAIQYNSDEEIRLRASYILDRYLHKHSQDGKQYCIQSKLTNEDFRKLLMTPRATPSSAPPSKSRHHDYYAKLRQQELERERELAEKYRDRARERRDGVNKDYEETELISTTANYRAVGPTAEADKSAAEKRRQLIQESKFLGGDMEHTHLVKGLDFALLQKVRAEITSKEREEEDIMEKVQKEVKKDEDPEQKIEFKTRLGKNPNTFAAVCKGRHIYRIVFKSRQYERNELFLPGRMAYVVDLEDEYADTDIPTTLIRSKADCPTMEAQTTLTTNDIVISKLTQILSYLRQGTRNKKMKKKEKGMAQSVRCNLNFDLKVSRHLYLV